MLSSNDEYIYIYWFELFLIVMQGDIGEYGGGGGGGVGVEKLGKQLSFSTVILVCRKASHPLNCKMPLQ